MKHLSIFVDAEKHLSVQEPDGSITKMICPFSQQPCGYQCPHCGRITELGPCLGPGYYIDLSCGGHTTRLEGKYHDTVKLMKFI